MKFSKKDFKKKYKSTKAKTKSKVGAEEVDESLFGLEPGEKHYTHNEIQTDTLPNPEDEWEKDISIDTDKFKVNTKNTGVDFARGGNMGVRWGTSNESTELDEAAQNEMKNMVKELLRQRTKENEFVSNDQYSDTDTNNQPDITQLKDINLIQKTTEFLNVLSDADPKDAEIVLNHLKANIKQGL